MIYYSVVDDETATAGEIVRRLVRLIATISPGAKRGATAPYTYVAWIMIEAGDAQPRSLAEAFPQPCEPTREDAQARVNGVPREGRPALREHDPAHGDEH